MCILDRDKPRCYILLSILISVSVMCIIVGSIEYNNQPQYDNKLMLLTNITKYDHNLPGTDIKCLYPYCYAASDKKGWCIIKTNNEIYNNHYVDVYYLGTPPRYSDCRLSQDIGIGLLYLIFGSILCAVCLCCLYCAYKDSDNYSIIS